jgi:hypothetical protein
MDDRGSILGRGTEFVLRHSVQTDPGTDPASYPMGTEGLFHGEAAEAWSWSLITHFHLVPRKLRMRGAILSLSHTSSYHAE